MALTTEQVEALKARQLAILDLMRELRRELEINADLLERHEHYTAEHIVEIDARLAESKTEIRRRIEGGTVRRIEPIAVEEPAPVEGEIIPEGGRTR